ncbi:hypothetical protein RsTz2092_04140 [Deferribacterales bacterium RsTz2092]|nr:hypothetical protein AGMMS49941_08310 [Deferribacterales bacterium]
MGSATALRVESADVLPAVEPRRYKYIINGITRYFTREELIAHQDKLMRNSGVKLSRKTIAKITDDVIETTLKYDGDPHGDMQGKHYTWAHQLEADGFADVIH